MWDQRKGLHAPPVATSTGLLTAEGESEGGTSGYLPRPSCGSHGHTWTHGPVNSSTKTSRWAPVSWTLSSAPAGRHVCVCVCVCVCERCFPYCWSLHASEKASAYYVHSNVYIYTGLQSLFKFFH